MSYGARIPIKPADSMWHNQKVAYDLPPFFTSTFAIWQCNHCTERRVWGNVGPEAGGRRAYLVCQMSGKVEPHSFIEMSTRWEGKPCPLEER